MTPTKLVIIIIITTTIIMTSICWPQSLQIISIKCSRSVMILSSMSLLNFCHIAVCFKWGMCVYAVSSIYIYLPRQLSLSLFSSAKLILFRVFIFILLHLCLCVCLSCMLLLLFFAGQWQISLGSRNQRLLPWNNIHSALHIVRFLVWFFFAWYWYNYAIRNLLNSVEKSFENIK